MENTIPKKQMDVILADMLKNDIAGIRGLLNNNGIVDASKFNDKDVKLAFLKSIKDSASFRTDLSNYLTSKLQGSQSFVTQDLARDFIDQPKLNAFGDDFAPAYTPTVTPTPTPTPKSGSGFWSSLGGLASKENLQSLFNTGLNVASTSLQNKANKDSEERALELERLRLEQINAQKELAKSGGGIGGGLSTGAIVGIAAGGVGLIVLIIVLTRPKK